MTSYTETGDCFGSWLEELSSGLPTPGGGSAAAVAVSMGAGLICMVCNLCIGNPKFSANEDRLRNVLRDAETARRKSLELADEDAREFEAVMAAYRMPRSTGDERLHRKRALQQALAAAAEPPLRLAQVAVEVLGFADAIVDCSNPNVITDVAVAAAMARADLESSMVNVAINLKSLDDRETKTRIADELDLCRPALYRAEHLKAVIGRRLT